MLASSFRVERLLGHLGIPLLVAWVFLKLSVCLYPRFFSEEMILVLVDFPSLYTDFAVYWEAPHIFALFVPAEVQSEWDYFLAVYHASCLSPVRVDFCILSLFLLLHRCKFERIAPLRISFMPRGLVVSIPLGVLLEYGWWGYIILSSGICIGVSLCVSLMPHVRLLRCTSLNRLPCAVDWVLVVWHWRGRGRAALLDRTRSREGLLAVGHTVFHGVLLFLS